MLDYVHIDLLSSYIAISHFTPTSKRLNFSIEYIFLYKFLFLWVAYNFHNGNHGFHLNTS